MSRDDSAQWDRKWDEDRSPRRVNRLLLTHEDLLTGGIALDVACGIGQNAIWLAQHGYHVLGADLSRIALRRAADAAREAGVPRRILFIQVDLDHWAPPPSCVNIICVFRFLDRSLIPALARAVRPGGLVFYATRHVGLLKRHPGATKTYLLQRGELPHLFRDWAVLSAHEDTENAMLIARKPR
jgi:SAM-dependent methyltransferase